MVTCGDCNIGTTVTDPNGHTTTSVYDGFGRLAETVQPDPNGNGGTNYPETFYVYDAGGQLVEKVAPAGPASAPNSLQQITAYQYDDLGRQTAVAQLDGTISSSTTTDAYGCGQRPSGQEKLRPRAFKATQQPHSAQRRPRRRSQVSHIPRRCWYCAVSTVRKPSPTKVATARTRLHAWAGSGGKANSFSSVRP